MKKRTDNIKIVLNFENFEGKESKLLCYIFDKFNNIVEKKHIKFKNSVGYASFFIKKIGRYKIKVAPEVEPEKIDKFQPFVKDFYFEKKPIEMEFLIPEVIWACWIKYPFVVRGNVKKDNVPICTGEVEIYEVDYRLCFMRIPDSILEKIRRHIIDIIKKPEIPIPPKPPCDVLPCPNPLEFEHIKTVNIDIPDSFSILYSSIEQFRQIIIKDIHKFKQLLCLPWVYPLWSKYCYRMDKLDTVSLNSDGYFSSVIWISMCEKDKPDLYFVVKQKINGIEKVIYKPEPIPCYTYWNHASGTYVHINVTDPDAITCPPISKPDTEETYVMPLGIGNDGWYQIEQAHIKPGMIPNIQRGLYRGDAPYGTELDIQMQFHKDIRNLNVYYYRWSYRKEGETDWKHIEGKVVHRYLQYHNGNFYINSKVLGPFNINGEANLFEIPDPDLDWVVINRGDRRFAFWETKNIEDGKYELRLEMFDNNGNKITNPTTKGFKYILPTGEEAGGIIPVDANLKVEPDGSIILRLHIDNQKTVADIKEIKFNGIPVGECQFIEYTNFNEIVTIKYTATHPNSFLDSYILTIHRGVSGQPVFSIPVAQRNIPQIDGSLSINVAELLENHKNCSFSIRLHTYPKTRDGYSRIRAYENADISSFALSEK
ncbi:hypothetical protein GWK41_03055 [Persephonella atlantica]|uniref:Uncharacterized protein n=1 Tax=Persephonella atlantica TaxID=2699429 RepID=A0ABS1GGN2_9AQUI|nr:hypothetical protein [Persephonella atlantica]MBK3332045.1 hypothetical protein [Persephonella atlantica]